MKNDVLLKSVECTNEVIKSFVLNLLKQFWHPGDEFHNRSIHRAVQNKWYTNVIIYDKHISIKTESKMDMRDGDHEHNRKQAANVMGAFMGCEVLESKEPEVYYAMQKLVHSDLNTYMYMSVLVQDCIDELPEVTPITINDILNAPIKDKASNQSEMLNYFEQKNGMDAGSEIYEYFNAGNGAIARCVVENFYTDVDVSWKYGDMYHRIFWDAELVGVIHRHGKYLDTYSYKSLDKEKWNDMISSIESELDWGRDDPVEHLNPDDDLFNDVRVHGRDLEEHKRD